jgi:hypothetical protein
MPSPVLLCSDVSREELEGLLRQYRLSLSWVSQEEPIPGSYWGECEAGLIGSRVLVRPDTPVHSLLHESCHYICMTPERRHGLDTNAGGDYAEENGVCYLQLLLADYLDGVGRARLMKDMDRWGYSFRLGSTRAWFEEDAEDARSWLENHRLIDTQSLPTWRLRA